MTFDSDVFLDTFFGPPNRIDIAQLPTDLAGLIAVLKARVSAPERPRVVLPARVGDTTKWYGIAVSSADGRELRQEMNAWLGHPVSDGVRGIPSDTTDELDRLVRSSVPHGGVALVARIDNDYLRVARDSMQGLAALWEVAPTRQSTAPRPVGRVLRDFYSALATHDRPAAQDALEEVRSRGLLSSTNLRFLIVEMVATLGSSAQLRDDDRLTDISLVTRPPRVTEYLANAANELFVESVDVLDSAALRGAALAVEEQWPGLVLHPSQIKSSSSARCLALVETLTDAPRESVIARLSESWADDPVVSACLRVLNSAPTPGSRSDPVLLIAIGDLEGAIKAAEGAGASVAAVGAALNAAAELGMADFSERALALVDLLTDDERDALLAHPVQAKRILSLRRSLEEAPRAANWLEWLEKPIEPSASRLDLLTEWSKTVPMHTAVLTTEYVDALLATMIDGLNDDRRPAIRNAIPVLLSAITPGGVLEPASVRLAVEIVDVVLSSAPGTVERNLALDLFAQLIDRGCTASEYRALLQAFSRSFEELGPRSFAFVADVVSVVLDGTVPDPEARDRLVLAGVATATRLLDRLSYEDALVLHFVFQAAGSRIPTRAQTENPTPRQLRAPNTIGIYSLEEAGARRAAAWIAELTPGIDVRLAHDHVNSSRLVSTVRAVEMFLVQTSKATHAASEAIAVAATGRTAIVHVGGRGASSLLRAYLSWLDGSSPSA